MSLRVKQRFDQQVSVMEHTYLYHPDPEKTDRRNDELLIMTVTITILMQTFTQTS